MKFSIKAYHVFVAACIVELAVSFRLPSINLWGRLSCGTTNTQISASPLTWPQLAGLLDETFPAPKEENESPKLTLYRDTNGWCPFCERVWLALEMKGIPYRERLIDLRNKPDWFLELVPTALVPAVLIYGEDEKEKPSRTLIWESLDILKALDDHFPETVRLIHDDNPEFMAAREMISRVTSAGFKYTIGSRAVNSTDLEKEELRVAFEGSLDDLDGWLADGSKTQGPFLLGAKPTGVDVEIVPTLERWRYQLPLTLGMNILEGRPHLSRWFTEGMEKLPAYTNRVAGDQYSWTAVASYFVRVFGGGGINGTSPVSPETEMAVQRAEEAARALVEKWDQETDSTATTVTMTAATTAAAKLISNYPAILKDCTDAEPKTQTELERATDVNHADKALRTVVQLLLSAASTSVEEILPPSYDSIEDAQDASVAMRTVAARLCVPRDMGMESAAVLRRTLLKVARGIEETHSLVVST